VAFFCRRWAPRETRIHDEAAVLIDDSHVVPLTLAAQAGASLLLAVLLWVTQGTQVGSSALLGGMVAVVPNAFLAARLLQPRRDPGAKAILRAAWLGEIGKWLLTGLLFGVIFAVVRPLSAPALFGGFVLAQLVTIGGLLIGGQAEQGRREGLK
jgi:ATP synthase protein I